MNTKLKSLWPHLAVIIFFCIISVVYVSPAIKGKTLQQYDVMQGVGMSHEAAEYKKATGEWSGWTNSMFGGMPTYMVYGGYTNGVIVKIFHFLGSLLWYYGSMIFFYLLGIYLLLIALECGYFISITAAIGYAFFSYNIIIIEVGHLSKVNALGYAPLMLAGMVWAYKNKPWLGAALFSLGAGLCFQSGHYQIAYYAGILVGIFGLFELWNAIKNKQMGNFAIGSVLILLLSGLALATLTARLWSASDYQKETIRAKSELTLDKKSPPTEGLDRDYAFEYSYGKLESFTLLIPDFSGGGSSGTLNEKSEAYKVLSKYSNDPQQTLQVVSSLPTYWGDQRYVAGAPYSGAIILFLFILGLFIADKRYRLPFAVGAIFFLMTSWGSNFGILNNLLFDYLPYFNKFRSLSMTQAISQICFVVLAGLALKSVTESLSWEKLKNPLLISLGLTAGFCLVFAVAPSLLSLRSENDTRLISQLTEMFGKNQASANELFNAIVEDRAAMLRSDAFRSLFFILAAAGVIWVLITKKIKNTNLALGALALLVLLDMWPVAKRHLNDASFKPKYYSTDELFQPSPAQQQVMADKDPNFRTIDFTSDPFNDSSPSYFYKNVGGGHPAKLRRYQELIQYQLGKNNMAAYNMLNTKYFITPAQAQGGQPIVQQNPEALGNAWFVNEIKFVKDANEEMKSLDIFNPSQTAFVDKQFSSQITNAKPQIDTTNKIRLTTYKPNHLTYSSNTKSAQNAIFSEIYYRGGIDWKAYIDGKETPHFRANYVLRGMAVPAGKHTIEFKFDPDSVRIGGQIETYASIGWVLLVLLALFMEYRKS